MEVILKTKAESSFIMGEQDDKILQTSDLFLSYIKALEMSTEWQPKTNGKLKTFQIEIQGRIVVKGTTVLNLPYDTVCNFFSDPGYSRHITNILDSIDILYQESKWDRKLKVIQMVMKFAGPIANREFLLAHTIKHENDNKVYMGSRSCLNYPYEQHKGTIMAMVYSSGFILERLTDGKTKMTMISDYDSRGNIPNFIKRWAAGKSVNFLKNVQEKIKKVSLKN